MADAEAALREILQAENEAAMGARIARVCRDEDERLALLEHACLRLPRLDDAGDMYTAWHVAHVVQLLVRGAGTLTPRHLAALVTLLEHNEAALGYGTLPSAIVATAERFAAAADGDAAALRLTLERLRAALAFTSFKKEGRQLAARVEALLGIEASCEPVPGERWADAARARVAELAPDEAAAWQALWRQAANATAARPSARWQTRTAELVAAPPLGRARFLLRLGEWLPLVEKPKAPLQMIDMQFKPPVSDVNTRVLTALAWALGGGGEPDAARLAGDLAAVCFSKIAGYGPVSSKVGNACVWALGAMPGLEGVAQLSRLRLRIKYAVAQRLIERSLNEAAARAGLSVADVEELAVPTFGLDAEARRRESLGASGWTMELALGRRGTVVTFTHPQKRAPKSVPAEVKSLPEWKELKKSISAIDQCLAVERARLEGYYLARRELPLGELHARAFRHPVVSQVARRLLWCVAPQGQPTRTTRFKDGRLVDLGNEPITDEQARVSLWHPLGMPRDEVAVWQDLLEHEGLVQPWKQAHREVYSLTSAEQQTRRRSIRFSGHIVRQHQFAALANARGWRFRLMGAFDSHNTPTLALPMWDLDVNLLVDFPGEHDDSTSGAGIYLHIRTDGIEFSRRGEAIALDEVPPLVFSEVMRDVDLIVSVSSIATDPAWRAQDAHGFAQYWRDTALGPLGPAADTRRVVIARLLQRLPTAARLGMDDRFLAVQGKLRRYKVHLGSGAVLLDPTEQPIVLGKAKELALELPFDGDTILQTILETALTLVDDDRIRDPDFRAAIGV